MQPEERDPAHLWEMLEACRAVAEFTKNVTREEFMSVGMGNEIRRLAVERELEILGEAARRISERFRREHPEVPWKELVGLRNVISHQYDKVNYAEIYGMVRERIPGLIVLFESLLPPSPRIKE